MNKSSPLKISIFPIQPMRNMEYIMLMIGIGLMEMFCIITTLVINAIIVKSLRSESENILIILRICISQEISIPKPSLEEFLFGKIYSVSDLSLIHI